MSNGVLSWFAGLDRTRRLVRTVVTLLAAASMVWAVAGPGALTVDAAGPTNSAAGHCGRDADDGGGHDHHHCCNCCAHPTSPPPVTPPRQTPPSRPVRKPVSARPTPAGHPQTTATPSPDAVTVPPAQQTPAESRPPVLAPPPLAMPAPVAPPVVATSPVSIYVATLAALLVAGAIAAVTIVFVRRSD